MFTSNKIIAQMLTGLVGAVIALIMVAYIVLVPLRAHTGSVSTSCEDDACTCQDNLKQLSLALVQYTQDYDEQFPIGHQGVATAGVGWFGGVADYQFGRANYRCPDDPTVATKPIYAFSYGFNANLSGNSPVYLAAPDLTVTIFELSGTPIYAPEYDEGASLGATVFSAAGDGTDGNLLAGRNASIVPGVAYATGYLGKRLPLSSGSQFPSAIGRHYRGANYAFADGHAQFFHAGDVSSGTNATNNTDAQTGTTTGKAAGTLNSAFQVTFSTI